MFDGGWISLTMESAKMDWKGDGKMVYQKKNKGIIFVYF